MNKVKEAVAHLNPGQVPVITAIQPICAIAKRVQWQWPSLYSDKKCVVMFVGLHTVRAAMTGVLMEAGVPSSGMADSFLSASSVTKHAICMNVTTFCLYILKQAYD